MCTDIVRHRQARRTPLAFASLAFALLLVGAPLSAAAQGTITGMVTEAGSQRPVVGAQVFVDGTTMGGLTNGQGRFLIPDVPEGDVVLRAQLIGYAAESEEVTVVSGETAVVEFEVQQSTIALDEIVVTGAGAATERRRLGNTIATVNMTDLQNAPISSVSEVLGGREPGVMGLTTGGMAGEGSRIRIRGSASLSQSNEPVIYVDGVRVDRAGGFGEGVGAGGGGGTSRLDDINPDAIERIEILKGSAAATLYGTQAANGVIQIFTKRGQSGEPRWNMTVEQGFSSYPLSRMKDHAGYVLADEPSKRNHGGMDIGTVGVGEVYGIDVAPYEVFETDLFGGLFSTGHTQTYSASVTGGSQAVTYYVGGRWHDENGPYDPPDEPGTGLRLATDENRRMQFNANVELFPFDALRLRASTNYMEMNHETPNNNNNIYGVVSSIVNSRPELATEGNTRGSPSFATTRENLHQLTTQEVQRFGGAFTAAYQPWASTSIDATIGIDFVNQGGVDFRPFGWNVDGLVNANVAGIRTANLRNNREVTLDVRGVSDLTLGADWTSRLTLGGQGFLTRTKQQWGEGSEFPGPGFEVITAGAEPDVFEELIEEANVGLLFEDQIGFRDYAFLTVGGRYDWHSAFGETTGGAFYPKVSTSIIPSQLPGWNSDLLSTLRLRAALGASGLQPGAFDQFTTYESLASQTGAGIAPSNLGNPDLKPERSLEWEVGTEVGLFADRASLNATYWNRTVTDALVERQFAPSGGFRDRQLDNIGELKSSGVEIGAQVVAVSSPNFSANIFANAAYLSEEITELGGAPALKVGDTYPRYRQFTMEGFHPGAFFGPILDESVEIPLHLGNCEPLSRAELTEYLSEPTDPTDLQPLVQSCGSSEMLENYLGKPVPDWQGSFGTDLTFFGNFSVGTLFEYRFGNFQIHDLDGAFRRSHNIIGRNIKEAAEVEATLLNPASSPEERVEAADKWVRELAALSPYDGLNEIHDADWLRLREVSLTYRAPAAWASRFGAQTISFTAAGRNLALWTKFPGTDPELNYISRGAGGDDLANNFGEGTVAWGVPIPRRFSFAVRAGF